MSYFISRLLNNSLRLKEVDLLNTSQKSKDYRKVKRYITSRVILFFPITLCIVLLWIIDKNKLHCELFSLHFVLYAFMFCAFPKLSFLFFLRYSLSHLLY